MASIDFLYSGADALTDWNAEKSYWKEILLLPEPQDRPDVIDNVQVFSPSWYEREQKQVFWASQRNICLLATGASAVGAVYLFTTGTAISVISAVALLAFSYFAYKRAREAEIQAHQWEKLPSDWLREQRAKAFEQGFSYALENDLKGSYEMHTKSGVLHPHEIVQLWEKNLAAWKRKSVEPIEGKGKWVDEFFNSPLFSEKAFHYAFPEGSPDYAASFAAYEKLRAVIEPIQNEHLQKRLTFEKKAEEKIQDGLKDISPYFVILQYNHRGIYQSQYIPNPRYWRMKEELSVWKAVELTKLEQKLYVALEPYFDQAVSILL